MVTYKFKLINSKVPVIKGKNVITDSNVGGTKNTYKIYRITYIEAYGFIASHPLWPFRKLVGTKTFWRPYQSVWDKKEHKVPAPYWGKGPLLNLWIVLSNDYPDPSKVRILLQDDDTTKHTTLVCGIPFLSQELNNNLKLNNSFYQSKFEKLCQKKKQKSSM
jgi:hypothetical protein